MTVVWIYLNTCICLPCSFVRHARGIMKLCSDLSDSEYELHKFSAYPLLSGRLLDIQGRSMKTRQYVYEGKNNISGLSHKYSWRMDRFSWNVVCARFLLFSLQNMNFVTGHIMIPFYFTVFGHDLSVFSP